MVCQELLQSFLKPLDFERCLSALLSNFGKLRYFQPGIEENMLESLCTCFSSFVMSASDDLTV